MATLKKSLPELTEQLLDAIDRVTESAHDLLSDPDYSPHDAATAETLGSLMNINHGLLVSLGVSHPRLDRVRELVDQLGVGYTKLTGAGGGGSAITLLKPQIQPSKLQALESMLDDEDFERFETTLGAEGDGVLWPSVLIDKDIDLDGFLAAENVEAIKLLVGDEPNSSGRGWKFWNTMETDEVNGI